MEVLIMTQTHLIKTLLESNSGKTLIAEILARNPDFKMDKVFTQLQEAPATKGILKDLEEKEINALSEELTGNFLEAELQGFKSGFDLALILLGLEPIYNILPEKIEELSWI